jgi:hypothetical protein
MVSYDGNGHKVALAELWHGNAMKGSKEAAGLLTHAKRLDD